MPPAGGQKRKRNERTYSQDESPRPSPYRPDLAQRQAYSQSPSQEAQENGTKPGGRLSRGGRVNANEASPSDQTDAHSQLTKSQNVDTDVRMSLNSEESNEISLQPRPYMYTYLTDKVVSTWDEHGKEALKNQILEATQNADDMILDVLMQEAVAASTTNRVNPEEVGEILRDVFAAEVPDTTSTHSFTLAQESLLSAISTLFTEDTPNPNVTSLAQLLSATEIDQSTLRLELDSKLLEQLSLIRSTFYRVGIRKQTNVLYRQANFNLMREESEGFAKLMTELFSTSGNEMPTGEVVENTVEKVKAMIGAFDLDVGRSLDVVLDVFASVLVRQCHFFVKFLRASPWWPSSENQTYDSTAIIDGLPDWALPGVSEWQLSEQQREALQTMIRARDIQFWPQARDEGLRAFFQLGHALASPKLMEELSADEDKDLRKQWIQETGTIPRSGNRDAAQLLGFKLRFYAPSTVRDGGDDLPKNLIYLAALLIKIGFISLHDLYPHIWRPDEEMEELKQHKAREKAERERAARPGAGSKNALLTAGALSDDTLPIPPRLRETTTRSSTPAKDSDDKQSAKDTPADTTDQKVLLLQSLLAIGAMPEALFILGRFPWMMELIPEMPTYINRILHHCLSDLYNKHRPLQQRNTLHSSKPYYETDLPGQQGQAKLEEAPQRKVLRWPQLDKDDFESDGVSYRFFWDEWTQGVPVCQTIDDLFTLSKTLLPLVGAKIGQDPSLVLKLARIGKASLDEDSSEFNKDRWLGLSRRVLLPSLSLTKANPGVVNEVFELISRFPTSSRYLMYLEWMNGRVAQRPELRTAFDQAKAETRDILKRISKTNVRPMARALAKVAYANPHIVITTALTQIEVYDSIADVFVEGARYFTDLGYDVLTWALISSMARAGRSRVQEGGIFTSRWLTALAHFAGKIYKRYALMKPGPILQYVSEQLGKGSSTDLVMLEQIVVSMAGIAPDTNFNDNQIAAMGGGPLLQSHTVMQLLDQRHTSKGSSKRLVKALQDHGLIAKLLLSMSQQRESCVFEEDKMPLKAVGNVFDELNRVLGQYLDLLRSNLTSEEFARIIPDVATMLNEFEIPPEIAFWIARPVIAKQIADFDKDNADNAKESPAKETNGDMDMADPESSEEDGEAVETEDVETSAATPTENELIGNIESGEQDIDTVVDEKWHPVLKTLMENVRGRLPSEVVDLIGVGFFITYWQLSLYDISVPSKSYEDEMGRQKKKIAAITSDRSNVSVSGSKAKEAQIKALQNVNDDLLAENKQHLKAYGESRARLQREKDQWFAGKSRLSTELNIALMEHCFLPRLICSPIDAYFCFKFAKFLHSTGTPNFRTLGFYDQLFKPERLAALIFTCTSRESDNLGRFINDLLKDLARWHQSKSIYEREAFGSKKNLPGFALKVENGKPQLLLDFESFRRILFKWHSNLYSALIKCLSSTEYMHIRNAISVLRSISTIYPAVDFHGKALQKTVDKLRESDKEDLKVASQALLGALHRREKQWMAPQAFRQGQDIPSQEKKLSTPQPETDKDKTGQEEGEAGEVDMADAPKATDDVNALEKPPTQAEPEQRPQKPAPGPARGGSEARSERRPPRSVESKPPHLPRKLSPPRYHQTSTLPTRPESDSRNGYRDSRSGRPTGESPRPDSRSSHARHGPSDRSHEPPYDPAHRYPRSERPPILDRDERPPRREYDPRVQDDRRHTERDPRERDQRHERENVRTSERDFPRTTDREYLRPTEYPERRRNEVPLDRRVDPPARPSVPTAAPIASAERPGNEEARPNFSIRGQAGEKRSSRPSSPRREERHATRPEDKRETPRSGPVPSPAGPRREGRGPPNRGPVDMQHGRLEQEPTHRAPSRPERASEGEPPSGPRGRNGPPNTRNQPPSTRPSQPSERPVPSGPGKHTRANSIPEPTDTSGVHPDRMNQIAPEPPRNQRPPPLQTSPPAGPRANNAPPSAPSGPSPSSRGPPSGPQAEAGRGSRRHQMATVNNTLAQAAQGPAGRGRGGSRQTNFPSQGAPRQDYPTPDVPNPNAMPIQPRTQRTEDERRPRNWGDETHVKDDRRPPRREDGSRGEGRGYRGPTEDGPPRKHPREEGVPYNGPPRGGGRGGDTKRVRRGG